MTKPKRSTATPTDALATLAHRHGVELAYTDNDGVRHQADPDAVVQVLSALGVPLTHQREAPTALDAQVRGPRSVIDDVHVVWTDRPSWPEVRLPVGVDPAHVWVTLELENGDISRRRFLSCIEKSEERSDPTDQRFEVTVKPTRGELSPGYHRLRIEGPGIEETSLVIVAHRCPEPARGWGGFLPLYAVRPGAEWGIGRFEDLGEVRSFLGELGASFLGTLPLFPTFLEGSASDPSPYLPITRLGWNEIYVNPLTLPELAISAEARQRLASDAFRDRMARVREADSVDHVEALALVRSVLELLATALFEGPSRRRQDLESFVAARPHLGRYATFRAERAAAGGGDDFRQATQYHLYAQWIAHLQLSEASGVGTGTGLYLDLPIGIHPDGFDPVEEPEAFVAGIHGGAPPDAFFQGGQDWAFPPLHPVGMRAHDYRYVISYLRQAMSHARLVRIDHVMGMHRMYWIPEGAPPSQGVYVRYPQEELRALVAVEAWRSGAAVVGEDLGTVPDGVRRAMRRDGMLRSWVFEFESSTEMPLPDPPGPCLASWATHDLAPFAGFFEGTDIDDREADGSLSRAEAEAERVARADWRRALARALGVAEDNPGDVLAGCLEHMAGGPARAVMVDLEDLWLERRPQNRPGTGVEGRNWRRRCARTLDQMTSDEDVTRLLRSMDRARRHEAVEVRDAVATGTLPEKARR